MMLKKFITTGVYQIQPLADKPKEPLLDLRPESSKARD